MVLALALHLDPVYVGRIIWRGFWSSPLRSLSPRGA